MDHRRTAVTKKSAIGGGRNNESPVRLYKRLKDNDNMIAFVLAIEFWQNRSRHSDGPAGGSWCLVGTSIPLCCCFVVVWSDSQTAPGTGSRRSLSTHNRARKWGGDAASQSQLKSETGKVVNIIVTFAFLFGFLVVLVRSQFSNLKKKHTHTSRSARHRLSLSLHQPPYHCYHEILQHDLLCHPRLFLYHCSGCPAARWRWRRRRQRRRRRRRRRRCTAATPTRTENKGACPARQFLLLLV
jgi:hypothetical protein